MEKKYYKSLEELNGKPIDINTGKVKEDLTDLFEDDTIKLSSSRRDFLKSLDSVLLLQLSRPAASNL